jgi:uncharacterized DUF497 family protein
LDFEWDPKKRASNLRKHGIAFEDAVAIFDGIYLEAPDDREGYAEDRFVVYGECAGRVLAVVCSWRGGARRIISARKAVKHERETYYQTLESLQSEPDQD